MADQLLRTVAQVIADSNYLIALTGAGISKESNVPTFRGKDGLWNKYNVMELATLRAFKDNPQLVWEWYAWRQNLIASCEPNPAHLTLANWERQGLLKSIVTQNVDGLHERAGSSNIFEIHGNIWRVKCMNCDYHGQLDAPASGVPSCPLCNGNLRPDVVWFGESLDRDLLNSVDAELRRTDVCLVIGTSAVVYPAASFPMVAKDLGATVIEINIETTPITDFVDFHLSGKAGEILPQIDQLL